MPNNARDQTSFDPASTKQSRIYCSEITIIKYRYDNGDDGGTSEPVLVSSLGPMVRGQGGADSRRRRA
eukprot:scaffold258920_cov26-Prasinocladus_malaysianus.AAC.1